MTVPYDTHYGHQCLNKDVAHFTSHAEVQVLDMLDRAVAGL